MEPYVTVKIKTKKLFGESEIIWNKPISSEFISNNLWRMKICNICFFNVKKKNHSTNMTGHESFNFEIKTNMTRQPYLWYSKLQNLSDEKDNLPIELFSIKVSEFEKDFTHSKFSNNCHSINSIENSLIITCENLSQNKYKLEDFEFESVVLINLFKRGH